MTVAALLGLPPMDGPTGGVATTVCWAMPMVRSRHRRYTRIRRGADPRRSNPQCSTVAGGLTDAKSMGALRGWMRAFSVVILRGRTARPLTFAGD